MRLSLHNKYSFFQIAKIEKILPRKGHERQIFRFGNRRVLLISSQRIASHSLQRDKSNNRRKVKKKINTYIPVFPFRSVTPDDWESFSNENILKAESERMASATLRGIIEDVLTSTSNDIQLQRNSVNAAFASRIAELKKTKETLENHLEKVSP